MRLIFLFCLYFLLHTNNTAQCEDNKIELHKIEQEAKDMLLITSKFNDLVESNKIPEVGTNVSMINCDKNIHVSINKINKSLLESNEYDIVKFNTEIESCDNLFVANITKIINEPPGKNIIRAFVCKKGDTVELMSVYKFDSNIKSWDKLR